MVGGTVFISLLALTAPAFDQDDAAFFNYMNNVTGARPVFRYQEYVPLVPELIAYALKDLPLAAQAVLYRVPPLLVMLLLYRELLLLFALGAGPVLAGGLALSIMAILRAVEWHIWANLTFVIWPMFLAALVHLVRRQEEGRPVSVAAAIGIVGAAVSVPAGIVVGAVLLVLAAYARDWRRRRQHLILAAILSASYLLLNAHVLATAISVEQPAVIAAAFRHGFTTEGRLSNVLVTIAVLVLVAAQIRAYRPHAASEAAGTTALVIAGLGSTAGVLVSDRLVRGDGAFAAVHALPAFIGMLVLTGRWVILTKDRVRRAALAGAFAGVAALAVGQQAYSHLRGPLETAMMKYRFLMVAEAFRRDCRDGDGMVFEHEDTSPVVLCRPRPFEVGRHPQIAFPPSVGVADPDARPDEQPVIVVGVPLV